MGVLTSFNIYVQMSAAHSLKFELIGQFGIGCEKKGENQVYVSL